ncbi:hypothetical protein AAMO2058_000006000 [Amorphochlora amoebiformis]
MESKGGMYPPEPSPVRRPLVLPCGVFDDVFSEEDLSDLKSDLIHVIDHSQAPPENEKAFVTGTYWVPLDAKARTPNAEGKNGVERAILYLTRQLKTRGRGIERIMDQAVGCEWWFQEQGPDDHPKEFHTDVNIEFNPEEKDEIKKSVYKYPLLSSVFYFGSLDHDKTIYPHLISPTVVFSQSPRPTNSIEHILQPMVPERALVCYPKPNRLMVFEGDLWHAVVAPYCCPHQRNAKGKPSTPILGRGWDVDTRYTLLVNWWKSKPIGPLPHPLKTTKKLRKSAPSPPNLPKSVPLKPSLKSPKFNKTPSKLLKSSPLHSAILPKSSLCTKVNSKLSKSHKSNPKTVAVGVRGSVTAVKLTVVNVEADQRPLEAFLNHALQWRKQIVPKEIHSKACPVCKKFDEKVVPVPKCATSESNTLESNWVEDALLVVYPKAASPVR